MKEFLDYFSADAGAYAEFRPRYPAALFEHLAAIAPGREAAWDCATGSGQAAVALAEWFGRVVASDASRNQIGAARAHPRVEYRVERAEASTQPTGSVDLVTVAQALHWLDRERFYAEARRVLRPGGIIAAWCYSVPRLEAGIDAVVDDFYSRAVGPYWAPDRALVETGYATVDFPFAELAPPPLAIEGTLTLDQLAGYLRTWSATRRYVDDRGVDPVPAVVAALEPLWGDPAAARPARWPLAFRIGRTGGRAGGLRPGGRLEPVGRPDGRAGRR